MCCWLITTTKKLATDNLCEKSRVSLPRGLSTTSDVRLLSIVQNYTRTRAQTHTHTAEFRFDRFVNATLVSEEFPEVKFNKRYLVIRMWCLCEIRRYGDTWHPFYFDKNISHRHPRRPVTRILVHSRVLSLFLSHYSHERSRTLYTHTLRIRKHVSYAYNLPWLRFSSFIERVTPPFPCKL